MAELVKNPLIEFTDEEKKVIKKQFFPPTATPEDMKYCMSVAASLGLNPILKEIYFVERKAKINGQWHTKVEPLVGRDGRLTIAHRSGVFDGMESWVEFKEYPRLTQKGWIYVKELVGCCRVYRKDMSRPFYVEVPFNEYAQKTKDGHLTSMWRDKPTTMIKKVAESQCLAKAFNINGVIDEFTPNEEIIEEGVSIVGNPAKKEDVKTLLSERDDEPMKEEAAYNVTHANGDNVGGDNADIEKNVENIEAEAELPDEQIVEI